MPIDDSTPFPDDFTWGVATASYQIEGAVDEDGRGESIWDRFSHTPGKILTGETGDVACDHYHRWPEDIELMRRLGVDAYRFSISWPRILPEGVGDVNGAGLDFYDRLVDELLRAGITPYPTLYHWDLPQALEDDGGWLDRNTAGAFADYAEIVVDRLGDRIEHWMTLNEPWCSSLLGYMAGFHAPGLTGVENGLTAAHHLLLAHGLAVPRIQAAGCNAGIVLNMDHMVPVSAHPADHAAADLEDQKFGRWFLDPVSGRGYPEGAVEDYGWDMTAVESGDLDVIATPIDQIGLNYYSTRVVRSDVVGDAERNELVAEPAEYTDMGWAVEPAGIIPLLERLHDYGHERIYITENGAAYPDQPDETGYVDDQDRISFLERHFEAVSEAIGRGVPVKGYFVWSFMDNFEWGFGYSKRFGLVRVDYDSQERIPK
ncbi:MAG: GH1 family beta-glucosidase, partial [Acidimicrobiia bacterium]